MKPGDLAEWAIWLSGKETEEHMHHFKEVVIPNVIKRTEQERGVKLANVRFVIKKPGEDRVPKVPDHISGPDVRLFVFVADVHPADSKPVIAKEEPGFVNDLKPEDQQRLREIARRMHKRANPALPRLKDHECDRIINMVGPDVVLKQILGKTLH